MSIKYVRKVEKSVKKAISKFPAYSYIFYNIAENSAEICNSKYYRSEINTLKREAFGEEKAIYFIIKKAVNELFRDLDLAREDSKKLPEMFFNLLNEDDVILQIISIFSIGKIGTIDDINRLLTNIPNNILYKKALMEILSEIRDLRFVSSLLEMLRNSDKCFTKIIENTLNEIVWENIEKKETFEILTRALETDDPKIKELIIGLLGYCHDEDIIRYIAKEIESEYKNIRLQVIYTLRKRIALKQSPVSYTPLTLPTN